MWGEYYPHVVFLNILQSVKTRWRTCEVGATLTLLASRTRSDLLQSIFVTYVILIYVVFLLCFKRMAVLWRRLMNDRVWNEGFLGYLTTLFHLQ
jgi:hypothetical protein